MMTASLSQPQPLPTQSTSNQLCPYSSVQALPYSMSHLPGPCPRLPSPTPVKPQGVPLASSVSAQVPVHECSLTDSWPRWWMAGKDMSSGTVRSQNGWMQSIQGREGPGCHMGFAFFPDSNGKLSMFLVFCCCCCFLARRGMIREADWEKSGWGRAALGKRAPATYRSSWEGCPDEK